MSHRKKIAILGGGAGALSAAFGLTRREGSRDRFEITVYQRGFRLGGKGASGRNRRAAQRIEEHGLHFWIGSYENAFSMIRACYDELARPAGAPLATWRDAFVPCTTGGVGEMSRGRWGVWLDEFRPNGRVPGDGGELFTIGDTLVEIAEIVLLGVTILLGPKGRIAKLVEGLGGALSSLARDASERLGDARDLLCSFIDWRRLAGGAPSSLRAAAATIAGLVDALFARAEPLFAERESVRHLFIIIDVFATCFRGIAKDGVLFDGFGVIEHWDLRAWLSHHGARKMTSESALVRGTYDFVFADAPGATLGAGTILRFMSRMVLDYRGAIFWKMQAGMGDVVFAPMYEVLRRRGVRFEFFHAVTRLGVARGERAIDVIEIDRQARLRGGADEYHPLIDVKGLPCWPSEPLYDQLEDGAALEEGWRSKGYDLESQWSAWPAASKRVLERGRDFDLVVLGVPIGVVPHIARELVDADPAWKRMIEEVPTAPTIALQLWLRDDLRDLGWLGPRTVIDAYAKPFSTWADMSHLIDREAWESVADKPRTIAYLCGRAPDVDLPRAAGAADWLGAQSALVRREASAWLDAYAGPLWPLATRVGAPDALDYAALVDPEGRSGVARLDAQYERLNVDPSERYTLAPSGSVQHRLRPDASGFDNLYLAGDWTRTGIDLGCVESAVASGLQASRAISGHPETVFGERDITLPRITPRVK